MLFRPSPVSLSGLLWKSPWRMSQARKMRARQRLQGVDQVIAEVQGSGVSCIALDRALELPTATEMPAKDKYTIFSAKDPGYRKSLHKVPKWTRITQRVNPTGF